MKTIIDIDINKYQEIHINEILKDMNLSNLNFLDLDSFKNRTIVAFYRDTNQEFKFSLINSNLKTCFLTQNCFYLKHGYKMKMKTVNNSLVFYFCDPLGHGLA